jgi:hypothetical protein
VFLNRLENPSLKPACLICDFRTFEPFQFVVGVVPDSNYTTTLSNAVEPSGYFMCHEV